MIYRQLEFVLSKHCSLISSTADILIENPNSNKPSAVDMGRTMGRPTLPSAKDDTVLPAPFHRMDDDTRTKLEQLRLRTPRYLFRAWKDSQPWISGGFKTLNSPEAIVPLAFRAGRGHSSIYDMTKEEFTDMVSKHLKYEKENFLTELSSWAASLTFAMLFYGDQHDGVFISIIDTQALKAHNEIFYVPGMDFLGCGRTKDMHHEYLAHGPIRGSAHRAVPMSAFVRAGFDLRSLPRPGAATRTRKPRYVSIKEVQAVRMVAQDYGYHFAAPMAVALVCLEKRLPSLFLRERDAGLDVILQGLSGLHFSPSWNRDDTVMEDIVYFGNYMDVRQFVDLMRAIARHQLRNLSRQYGMVAKNSNDGDDGADKEDSSGDVHMDGYGTGTSSGRRTNGKRFARPPHKSANSCMMVFRSRKGKTEVFQRKERTALGASVARGDARVVKRAKSRTAIRENTTALVRLMKELDDDRKNKAERGR
jgi:hypothetical protein